MGDEDKTQEQIINDLAILRESLRQCTADLRARNQDLDDVARYVVSEFKSPLGVIIGFAELLEEDYASLSDEELRHCVHTIKQSGRRLGKMLNALLVLANSRRLFDNVWYAAYLTAMGEMSLSQWDGLLTAVEGSKFWSDSSSLERLGWLRMVGASSEEWVFEGWRKGQHKVRTVWSPDEEKAFAVHALGRSFVKSLPGWFALEMARAWIADFKPEAHPRVGDKISLGSLL